jgi:hypothetical protein
VAVAAEVVVMAEEAAVARAALAAAVVAAATVAAAVAAVAAAAVVAVVAAAARAVAVVAAATITKGLSRERGDPAHGVKLPTPCDWRDTGPQHPLVDFVFGSVDPRLR